MGGEGSILAMIISEKNNRSLRRKRKFFNKDKLEDKMNQYHMAIQDRPVSKAKLMRIRRRTLEDRRRSNVRLILALITAAGISLILILLITHFINQL